MQSPFYYAVTLHQDSTVTTELAPWINVLPVNPFIKCAILADDVGQDPPGFYVYNGIHWVFAMAMTEVSASIIRGDTLSVYSNKVDSATAPAGSTVFKNGIVQPDLNITPGRFIWLTRTPPAGGSGGGAVESVNGLTGVVVINATNLPGLATVGRTGSYNDLSDKPAPYALTAATATALGGVIVPAASNLTVDAQGNVDLKAGVLNSIASKFGTAADSGTGTSLIRSATAGTLTLKTLSANNGVSVVDDGSGNLTIMGSPYSLPAATASALGGVKVGSGLSVTGDGTLSANAQALTPATASTLGGVKVGTGLAVTGDGTLSATATPYTLPIASGTVLGGFKVGTGLTIDSSTGVLTATATPYTLPAATISTLGGIIVGSGLSVDGSGVLSASVGAVATTTTLGVIKVGSGLNVAGDGTLSAAVSVASAGTLGQVRVGSGLSIDGAGILSVTTTGGVTSLNTKTGAVVVAAGSGIAVDNSGANVVVNLALTGALVNTALGYTAYNGVTNPSGFLTANQAVTLSGDATGTGTTAITVALSNTGVAAGTYKSVTVDAKGRVTAATNPTTLTAFGITDALNSVSGGSVGGTITLTGGAKVTGLPTPTAGGDAASKTYVDNAVAAVAVGTSWRLNAQAASTGNLTLSGTQTIDGYAAVVNDRVLVKDQTDQTQNGVYVVAAGAWTRATDTDTGPELLGMAILVLNGTVNALSQWVNTNTGSITVGTTNVTYTKLQGNGVVYSAGTGLTLTGNTFSITNTGVTAGTFSKVTVNAQGQVTAGANLASSDITTALGFTPYNSTNPSNYISANQNITLSGDATGTGTTAIALVLANSGVTAGTYKSVTVDAKGRVTAGTNPTTLAGYGITDGLSGTAGGSLTGTITLSGAGLITGVPTPTNNSDAAPKVYVDTQLANAVNSASWKSRVAAATTSNITLSGAQTIDGYSAVAGDRILVKNQTDATQNGIYVVAGGAWTRAADANSSAYLLGSIAIVLNGTVNALSQWLNTNTGSITIGTTSIGYSQTAGAGATYTAGTGLTLTGNQFSITNSGVTAGTFTKVTVNAQGQVTTGAALASSDVTTALGYTPLQNNQTITLSGDVTGSGSTAITATLGNSGVTAGTYTKVTVDAKGRVTVGAALASTDVTNALTYTPVNKAGDNLTGALNFTFVNANSAATTPIGAALANNINILGSATITDFDSSVAGATRTLFFQGAATLTHSAGHLILPTSANIVTAIGDVAIFVCIGGANWQCASYMKVTGQALVASSDNTKLPLAGGSMTGAINEAPIVTLASAPTTNIGAAGANTINITGNSSITAFDTIQAGTIRRLVFAAAGAVLVHNGTSIIMPSGGSVTSSAGDIAEFVSLGGGNWRCLYYTKVGGAFATLNGVETLTNKTLTNATITNFTESGVAASSASYTVDLTQGTDFEITTTGNLTINLPTPLAGKSYTLTIVYGGAHTVTFAGGGTIAYANGTAPTPTSVSGKTDIYVCKCNRAATKTFVSDGGRNF